MKMIALILAVLCLCTGCANFHIGTTTTTGPAVISTTTTTATATQTTTATEPAPDPHELRRQMLSERLGGDWIVSVDDYGSYAYVDGGKAPFLLTGLEEDAPLWQDAAFLQTAQRLTRVGVTVDGTAYGTTAIHRQFYQACLDMLTAMGYAVDESQIVGTLQDSVIRKAVELDLADFYEGLDEQHELNLAMTVSDWWYMLLRLLTAMESRVLCKAGKAMTIQDAADYWVLFTQNAAPFVGSNMLLTRIQLARLLRDDYETRHGELQLRGRDLEPCQDVDGDMADEVQLIRENDILSTYPDWKHFTPDMTFNANLLLSWLQEYLCREFAQEGGNIAYQDLMARLLPLAEHYTAQSIPREPVTVVDNRQYDIYVDQMDGSEYASMNCMCAMTCMALRWANPELAYIQPDDLRRQYPSITEGWYMNQVEEQLDVYGVPYRALDASLYSILGALDAGHIVLAQFSEWAVNESGHCYAIVGYRRHGGALWFIVEDSSGGVVGKYGRDRNDGALVDALYSLWSIKRFSRQVLEVGRAVN